MLQMSKLGMWDHLGYPLFKTKALSINPIKTKFGPPNPKGEMKC
jgi:hypothetical protein